MSFFKTKFVAVLSPLLCVSFTLFSLGVSHPVFAQHSEVTEIKTEDLPPENTTGGAGKSKSKQSTQQTSESDQALEEFANKEATRTTGIVTDATDSTAAVNPTGNQGFGLGKFEAAGKSSTKSLNSFVTTALPILTQALGTGLGMRYLGGYGNPLAAEKPKDSLNPKNWTSSTKVLVGVVIVGGIAASVYFSSVGQTENSGDGSESQVVTEPGKDTVALSSAERAKVEAQFKNKIKDVAPLYGMDSLKTEKAARALTDRVFEDSLRRGAAPREYNIEDVIQEEELVDTSRVQALHKVLDTAHKHQTDSARRANPEKRLTALKGVLTELSDKIGGVIENTTDSSRTTSELRVIKDKADKEIKRINLAIDSVKSQPNR